MNVPALRFKEFEKPWDVSILGEILKERTEITNDDIPIYSLTIENGVTPKTDRYEREHLVADKDSAYKLVMQNDFAFNPMNLRFGAIGKHSEKHSVKVSKYYNIFYCKPCANHSFFDAYFRTSKMISFYDKMSSGSLAEKKRVHFSDFLKFQIPVPTYQEQTKIATFLTAIDEKISQLTQKTDLLAQYKKGVMQQIFSQELRFKDDDGSEFPAWINTTLADCASFYRGGSLAKNDIEDNGLYPCVHYGELFTIYSEVITTIKSKTNIPNGFNSQYGDILMPSSDVTPAGLAKASCILHAGVVLGGDINIIRVNKTIYPVFLSYLLNFEKNKIIQLVSGTTVKHIYIKDIKSIDLSIPTSTQEQTKIAHFLSAIDDKITQTQAELDAVKQYKQGLLQQMFI